MPAAEEQERHERDGVRRELLLRRRPHARNQLRADPEPDESGDDEEQRRDPTRPGVDRRLVGRRREARLARKRAGDGGQAEERDQHEPRDPRGGEARARPPRGAVA